MTKFLLFILFVVSQTVQAQEVADSSNTVNSLVVYRQKTNLSYPVNQDDTLQFNRSKSIFHWDTAKFSNNPGLQQLKEAFPNAKPSKQSIKIQSEIYYGHRVNLFDTTKDSLFSLMGLKYIHKLLYLKEKTPKIDWHIKDSTKYIGNYKVRKATTHFRGHNYTAWFTPKIPVPYGPWKLHGLPGLILEAYNWPKDIWFSAQKVVTNAHKTLPSVQLSGNEHIINLAEYKDILKHYEKYQRQQLMKITRSFKDLSEEDRANMKYHIQPVRHMEIFQ